MYSISSKVAKFSLLYISSFVWYFIVLPGIGL